MLRSSIGWLRSDEGHVNSNAPLQLSLGFAAFTHRGGLADR
jgi:hypothetical protein